MFFSAFRPMALFAGMILLALGSMAASTAAPAGSPEGDAIRIGRFLPVKPISRAQRPAGITATLSNFTESPLTLSVRLTLPPGLLLTEGVEEASITIADMGEVTQGWFVTAEKAGVYDLRLEARRGEAVVATNTLSMPFIDPAPISTPAYIPEPEPVETDLLVGAHHCPLWEADKPFMWAQLLKHPERTPALGFYAGENPEVSDWETKWATEHGISFFIYCWYRTSQGGAVETQFGRAIHDALFRSRFVNKMKFTIMWENQVKGKAGVSDEADLLNNLLPYWMENYFTHPSYLKVDNKPVLFIYRPEFLIEDLGGEDKVLAAFDKMRAAARDAGFDGLYLMGEYRGLDAEHLKLMKRIGLDYTFAYCWYVPDNPTPQQAIDTQMDYIRKTRAMNILPEVVTLSQAWSGWQDEGTIWKIPPPEYQSLLEQAKAEIATFPKNELGSRMVILDNWNEWGEGHYIAPYREYGFGYLDAVRKAFSKGSEPHTDLIPEDIGRGPYDTAYREFTQKNEELHRRMAQKASKPGDNEPGRIGWWAFDEPEEDNIAFDYSGHRLSGAVHDARRAPGVDGNALICKGGAIEIADSPLLSPTAALTLSCWVKADTAGQANNWFVNRVFQGGTDTGYRFGILEGKACFEVPQTAFSHHLKGTTDIPAGQWTHLAGTFDGQVMRLYVNGREEGALERPGPVRSNNARLCLGNYDVGHAAFFTGLLDEVKLYDRALTPDEILHQYRGVTSGEK